MKNAGFTRGFGLLEKHLSQKRVARANSLISNGLRSGHVLDIGCGNFPYFLSQTMFAKKTGVDKEVGVAAHGLDGIELRQWDVGNEKMLPFSNDSFEAVTMLAVLEHLEPENLVEVLDEIYRVLKNKGSLILTSPVSWTAPLLFAMSRAGLLSKTEIDDHKYTYSMKELSAVVAKTKFCNCTVAKGFFELGMNMWMRIEKSVG